MKLEIFTMIVLCVIALLIGILPALAFTNLFTKYEPSSNSYELPKTVKTYWPLTYKE